MFGGAIMENEKLLKSKILSEQNALVKVEKELNEMIKQINEHINILKVEELQLRANLFAEQHQNEEKPESKYKIIDVPEFINSQTLDLGVSQQNVSTFDEEYDSE